MNFQREYWEKCYQQIKSSSVLTKPEERKILLQRIKDLEAGKAGQAFLKLQQDKANAKKHVKELQQDLEDLQVDYHTLENKEQLIRYQCDSLERDYQDLKTEKQNLTNLANSQIQKLEQERDQIKNSFTNGSTVGNTHWIYHKNLTEQVESERDQALADLATERDRVTELGNDLIRITNEISDQQRELKQRGKLITDLQQKLDFVNSKLKNLPALFNQLLEAVKKATFLTGKKELKETISRIEELMDWERSPLTETPNTPFNEGQE